MKEIFIFVFFVALCVNGFAAAEFNHIANEKGYEGTKYGWWCFFYAFAGYFMVAALPDRRKTTPVSPTVSATPVQENDELPEL